MIWKARNEDGTLVQFPFCPWRDTDKMIWVMSMEGNPKWPGEPIKEDESTKDLTWEDAPISVE